VNMYTYYKIKDAFIIALIAVMLVFIYQQTKDYDAFSCKAGVYHVYENGNVYGAAREFCSGNMTNAVDHIMKANDLDKSDLGYLHINSKLIVPAIESK